MFPGLNVELEFSGFRLMKENRFLFLNHYAVLHNGHLFICVIKSHLPKF